MKQKCKCPAGVPEWLVTFGDMMSLLLTFFILIVSFSELKVDRRFRDVVHAVKEAFGYVTGAGLMKSEIPPTDSLIEVIKNIALKSKKFKQVSNAEDPGITGKQTTVKSVREGLIFTIGGQITFERGSATLKQASIVELGKIAELVRGHNNKIEIRGHAAHNDLVATSPYTSLWELSNARGLAVMRVLTGPTYRLRAQRFRVVASADYEPLVERAYSESRMAINRRVEIIARETLIQDLQGEQSP